MTITTKLKPYQQRLVEEMDELRLKRANLEAFINFEHSYKQLPDEEQARMLKQLDLMRQYEAILQERINAFFA